MNVEQPIYQKLQLKQYENPGGRVLSTDSEGKLILVDGAPGSVTPIFLTEADTQWVDINGTGIINIPNWQSDFAHLILGNIVRADIWVKIGGKWFDHSSTIPDPTFNGFDTLLTSIKWTLNVDGIIQKIKIRLL